MDGIKNTLTAKVGPLPAYAWAVLALGAYLAYSYITKTGFFAPKTDSGTTAGGGTSGALPGPGDAGGILSGGGPPVGGPGSTGTGGPNGTNPVPVYYSPSDGGFTSNPLASYAPASSTGTVSYGAGPPSAGDLPQGSYSIAGPAPLSSQGATSITTPTGIKSTPGKSGGYTV